MDIKKALEYERQEDIETTSTLLNTLGPKALEKKGLAMLNLQVESTSTGLGGRTLVELGPDKAIGNWDPCVRVGDIVNVDKQPKQKQPPAGFQAVVTKVSRNSLVVAADSDDIDLPDGRLWLVKLVNEATYKRLNWATTRYDKSDSSLLALVKGDYPAAVARKPLSKPFALLNGPQTEAVEYALGSNLCVIHGPPGTGKTATLVEIIRQLVASGERVLVCGPSNISVDNIVERLAPHIKGLLRLGHPARLLDSIASHSLDLVSKSSNQGQVLRELRAEIDQSVSKVRKTRGLEKKKLFGHIKDLRKDYRQREQAVVRDLIFEAKVVVATLHTAGSPYLGDAVNNYGRPLFSTVVIDEVSQALIPQCWIPMVIEPRATRLVIAGDNKQLPPTIKSENQQVKTVLERTLFDELVDKHGEQVKHLISIQYRMAQEIMDFPSAEMYQGKLTADRSVAGNRLHQLAHVEKNPTTESVVLWIDTQGDMYPEQREEDGFSTKNEGEAGLVANYVVKLRESGVLPSEIGVISPYNAQVALLRQLIPDIEVSSVDGFQGREKEVIILSLVRSNENHEVGFLSDDRRINVAITRPRRQLVVVGDSDTVGRHGFLKKWVDWSQDNMDLEYPE